VLRSECVVCPDCLNLLVFLCRTSEPLGGPPVVTDTVKLRISECNGLQIAAGMHRRFVNC
jgi:hypothetical protein